MVLNRPPSLSCILAYACSIMQLRYVRVMRPKWDVQGRMGWTQPTHLKLRFLTHHVASWRSGLRGDTAPLATLPCLSCIQGFYTSSGSTSVTSM